MGEQDSAIEHYHTLNPRCRVFTYVTRVDLRFCHPLDRVERDTCYDLWFSMGGNYSDPKRLRLTLHGASPTGGYHLYPGMTLYINVKSIRDRQWEDVHYVFFDLDDGAELLYCRDFDITIEEALFD